HLGGRLRTLCDQEPRDRPVPTPDRPVRGRDLPDGLPLPPRVRRVQHHQSGLSPGHDRGLFASRFPDRGARTADQTDPVAAGLLPWADLHAHGRPGSDPGRQARTHQGLHALERRRSLHGQGAVHACFSLADEHLCNSPIQVCRAAADCAIVRPMAATKTIELRTAIPGPRSKEILGRKDRVVADPLSVYVPVVIERGFHGRTLLSLSLTSKTHPYKAGLDPFAPEVYRLPFAQDYRGPTAAEALAALERAFVTNVAAESVAAIVIEPVQGEGGFVVAPPEFLEGIRRICDDNGIVLVVDEVQTGYGRTGKMWGIEHYDVEPDVMTIAKSIAAGLPLSGVIGKAA